MNNIRQLLKEELLISERKNLLSAHSLQVINSSEHITHVLGINIPINEAYALNVRKLIIEEQILLEGMLDSITKYVGNAVEKGKEAAISVVDSVKNFKDIALLLKDLILSPEYMGTAVKAIQGVVKKIGLELQKKLQLIITTIGARIAGFSDRFTKLIEHVLNVLNSLSSQTGWKGFLMMLGFCTLIKYLDGTILGKISDAGVSFLSKHPNIVDGISEVLNSFKSFSNTVTSAIDIQPILAWFTELGVGTVLSSLFVGINVINIMAEVLTPVIKSIDWSKKLVKT